MGLKGIDGLVNKMEAVEKVNQLYPYRAGIVVLNFSRERFRQQNWIDDTTEPWKRRQLDPGGRGTLIGKGSGSLKRRTRIVAHNARRLVIGNDHPAAAAHNEGMKIRITKKMRGFFFYKAKELREAGRLKEAQYYSNLATTKKQFITIPRRQYLGNSAYQTRQIERQQTADYAKALKS